MALVTDESTSEYRNLCLSYYKGDLDDIYQDFRDRWISTDAQQPISKQQFCFESEIAKAVTRRANALPVNFTLDAPQDDKSEKLKKHWEEYFKGSNFDNKPLVQVLNDIYIDMEVGGAAIMVGYRDEDNPKVPYWIKQTNIEYTPITDDDDIFAVSGYIFTLHRQEIDQDGNSKDVTVTVTITAERQVTKVDDVVQDKGTVKFDVVDSEKKPVLAVVVFGREDLDGIYYRPGMSCMLNGQRALNQALTKRNEATKYDSFGIWCPADNDFAGLDMGASSAGGRSSWSIRPGNYVPFPIAKVGGATSIASIEKEIEEAREDIRAAGLFVDSSEVTGSTNGESGRSKLIGTRGLRDYIARMLPKIEDSLNLMLEISGYLSGVKTDNIKFKSPPVDKEDPATIVAKAEMLWLWGFKQEALRNIGYNNEQVENLMLELEDTEKTEDDKSLKNARNEALEVG